ncbi:MAG: isopeptide-forming domain-containing fimbrial protein [Ruminococcus sp.]|nr:isopeptide-forming domain-containing fimbrial protein [Ruminococcus sp.]MDD6531702.1 isopeptide-forming domain-containing fimbrial protein [Ruminococcus sp.]
MKHFKKFFSYLVALTMVLSLAAFTGVKVHAEGNYTLTINNTSAGHILNMYQILTGDVYEKKLSNAKWGTGVARIEGIKTAIKSGENVSEADMTTIAGIQDSEIANKIEHNNNVYDTKTVNEKSESVTFDKVDGGYYLITDEVPTTTTDATDATAKKHTVTYSIVQVVGSITVNEKAGTIQSEKKVEDVNDSTGDVTKEDVSHSLLRESKLGDSADYGIGEPIKYTIEAKLPENYESYVKFPLTFVDTMSKGLTYNNDAILHFGKDDTGVEVKNLNENQLVKDSTKVEYSSAEENKDDATKNTATKYSWAIKDLKTLATAQGKTLNAGDIVYITYSAKLNEQATINYAGNPNKMHIEYNNNPEIDTTKTNDQTPDDTNIVFTYDVVFNKVKQDQTPLPGADFKLEKWIKDTSAEGGHWATLADSKLEGEAVKPVEYHGKKIKSDDGTKFTFHGLDDGRYKVTETTTPDGYNTIDPVEFTINASHVTYSSNPVLTQENLSATSNKLTFTKSVNEGSLSANVVNQSGSTLPSTGGMGTTLLYVAGGILVACAAAYVVMSRKHSTNK